MCQDESFFSIISLMWPWKWLLQWHPRVRLLIVDCQFFKPKVHGLFTDFPRPYFEISRTFLNMNLPTVQPKNNACARSGSRSSCTTEHASGEKKFNCASSARSSKTKKFKILSARSCKKLRVLAKTANTCKKFTVVGLTSNRQI